MCSIACAPALLSYGEFVYSQYACGSRFTFSTFARLAAFTRNWRLGIKRRKLDFPFVQLEHALVAVRSAPGLASRIFVGQISFTRSRTPAFCRSAAD